MKIVKVALGVLMTVFTVYFFGSSFTAAADFVSEYCPADPDAPTMSFGYVQVFNEDGSIYGTKDGDGTYLHNIIPTDFDVRSVGDAKSFGELKVYRTNDECVFVAEKSESKSPLRFDFLDGDGVVVARAYNIEAGVTYKLASEYCSDFADVATYDLGSVKKPELSLSRFVYYMTK